MRNWLLLTLALGIAGTGCNLILGNDEHTYEPDASTDSSTADDQTLVDVGSDSAELTDGGVKTTRDGETGRDADASDGEGSKADASEAGPHVPTCTGGGFCSPGACELGVNVCDGGALECAVTGNASNGATCDAGAVCSAGACAACSGGTDCTEAGSCQKMTIACNAGSAVCTAAGLVTDGTQCGSNLYCNAGACKACTNGASCAPTGKPCDQGVVSCSQGQVVCTDKGTFAQSGTSCGTNMVCNASGACVACAANVQCTPSANPCHLGLTSCASGASVCVDTGNPQVDGTDCTGTNACNRTYTCQSGTCTGSSPVVCTASDQCHTAGTCNTTTGVCSNPVATGVSCNDGNACTTGDTCQSNGTCSGTAVACNSPPACHSAGTCSGGTCSYPVATGASCSDGNACTTGDTCQSDGTCSGTAVTCNSPPACHTAGTCSGGACSYPVATGASCGTNEVCNSSGSCGCASGYNSCGGQCVTYTTAANCGSCGHSCGGGTCSSGNTCTRWAVGSGFTNAPVQIASDGTHVFWADTGTNAVYQVPLAGGSATTLAMDSSFSTIPTSPYVWAMSTESGTVAWVTSTALWTSPVGGPGMKQVFTFPPSVSSLETIALNAAGTRAAVMATTTSGTSSGALSELYDCPIGGTSCTDVGSIPFVPTGNAANAGTYFFEDLSAETIEGFTFGTTTVSNLVSSASATQSGVAIDASHIYWLSNNGFVSAPLGGGSATLIATLPPNLLGALGFASDSRNVYATVNELSASGSAAYVMYAPLTSGGAAPLALYAENAAGAVVAAGGFVFWIDQSTIYGIAAP
jgi:hypothetical protein